MRLAPDPIHTSIERALAPEGDKQSMHDGKGGLYYTSLHQASDISAFNTPLAGLDDAENGKICAEYVDPREVFAMAELYERGPPAKIPDEYDLLNDGMINEYLEVHKDVLKLGPWAESLFAKRELLIRLRAAKNDPANFAARLLVGSMAALTSLNLDWVFLMCNRRTESEYHTQYAMPLLETICKLRFPNLRAFQLRNAVTHGTMLQDLVPLFGTSGLSFLDFMEAHQSLQCLGWPLAHFFMAHREARDVRDRIDRVIENLSTSITDLRVDARYHGSGEPQSQTDERLGSLAERQRRRLFITDFASRMQKVKHIKIEGCIPRDERREILRALRKCHLKRIISIGLSSPLGNTWGEHGVDIRELDDGYFVANDFLEAEDTDAITALATSPLQPPKEPYIPSFGWGPGPPLLHTIASHHAATITELKFCGYQGAPIVGCPTPITASFLYPLRHFHELRQLMLSMWLRTFFEDDWQDPDIIRYWVDSRDPSSTALVPVPVDGEEGPESGAWARQLRECYAPDVLARQVRNAVAEHLSPRAKERKGGVRVRASFSLGEEVSNNFDIDVWIGKDDEILEFQGPREEFEPERRREKLESRKWF
ncbi:MAG: hypothetical protein M1822_000679 [Bathelium mastoideum]|nr:MAG: hypothetical protein M1822_000679 [Bathelium mastoideum]